MGSEPYKVLVPWRFAAVSIILPVLAAFSVGRGFRIILIERPQRELGLQTSIGQQLAITLVDKALPSPKIREDKEVPKTIFTSKNYDTAASVSAKTIMMEKKKHDNSAPVHVEKKKKHAAKRHWQECPVAEDATEIPEGCQASPSTIARYADYDSEDEEEEEEELHLPAGQHLLVDIKDVDGAFLDDEQRLAQAMVDVVWESDLTLLSYHCHKLSPSGVSCVGVLLESHISFHTWPDEGVITLDLFTCGSGLLIPVVPIIERLFAVPQKATSGEKVDEPTMVWAHKLRGFRPEDDKASRPLRTQDLGIEVLGIMDMDMKKEIASVKTKYQQIDIYDLIDPKFQDILSYRRSLSDDGSYEAKHPELYKPNRKVFLDGTLQSTLKGNEAYHESLVHPGMFAHKNPRRVAIIGGGEGATLREVLKHETVTHVTMLEIDEEMVETSRQFLSSWNDCSDVVGSTQSCFEDLRARVLFEDALAWFMDRFSEKAVIEEEKFDVIIMDALDPQEDIPFAKVLYGDEVFTKSLANALNDDGIIIMQLGKVPGSIDPPDEMTNSESRGTLIKYLEKYGFESMHAYSESHCGFGDPWTYLVACKDYRCRQKWYANSAEVDVAIYHRILRTYSGSPALKYFDGATQQIFQVPSKVFETVYCRQLETPEECSYLLGYNPFITNIPASSFEVKKNDNVFTGFGVYATVEIPRNSMIMQEKSIHAVNLPPSTFDLVEKFSSISNDVERAVSPFSRYIEHYGFENRLYGYHGFDAPASILQFVGHGCGGSHNVNSDPNFKLTEATADSGRMPATHYPKGYWKDVFNPVVERHLPHLIGGYDVAVRDILAGEELLDNYLTSVSSEGHWKEMVDYLVEKCRKVQQSEGVVQA